MSNLHDVVDTLARALAKADGKVWWTEAFPAAYRAQATALLADGWTVIPPASDITPGGNPTCPDCGRWYGPGEEHECPIPPKKDVAQVHLVRSNGDRHPVGKVGSGSIYANTRVECANGAVVLVAPDGLVTTTSMAEEREARWARDANE